MALAERAELVARLSLKDDFSGPLGAATGKVNSSLQGVSRQVGITGHAISTALGIGIERAVSAGVGALAGAFRGGEASLQELEAVGLRTNAVIQSTGGVAGITAEQVRKLAEQYENLSTNDDKAIQNTENLLLTFTSIRKEAFEPALLAILDMNAALGGGDEGLQGTAIAVGKALQDPIRGIVALRRQGVNFSEDQQKVIKSLVETGDLFGAQQLILKELNTEFGGQAGAFGTGRAADVRRLQDAVEDFQRAFATGLAPAVDAARSGLTTLLRDPQIVQGIQNLGEGITEFLTPANISEGIGLLKGAFSTVAELLPTIKDAAVITGGVLKEAVSLFTSLPPDIQKLAIGALAVNKLTGGAASNVIGSLLQLGLSSLKTITAGQVTVIGASVTGAGGAAGAAGAAGGGALRSLATVGSVVIAAASIAELVHVFQEQNANSTAQAQAIQDGLDASITGKTMPQLQTALAGVNEGISKIQSNPLLTLVQGDALKTLQNMQQQLSDTIAIQTGSVVSADRMADRISDVAMNQATANSLLGTIRDKPWETTVNTAVTVNAAVSVSAVTAAQAFVKTYETTTLNRQTTSRT